MANISAIKLPSGNTYAIKDNISGYTTNTGTITKVSTTAGSHSTIDISSGAASFNVPTKTSHITNDSGFLTNSTLYEANLNWGGKDFSAGYSPIDAAMIDVLGANRFAFLKAAGLTIEYSTNGGTSYTDYGATDVQKVGLFSSGQAFYLGKHTSNGSCTTNDRLRVTIDTGAAGIYTVLNKIAIYMSTSGATVQVLIEKALQDTPTTFSIHKDWTGISGWSGWNILNISDLTTYGNSASWQYGRVRFTFRQTAVNTTYTSANISKIMGFGGVGWTVPSTMAATGHLYSYDSSQNATFPAKVTATSFSGNLTGNVTGNVSGSAGSVAWSGVSSKPTTLSGYGITDAKISNGTITLGGNTITPLTSYTETDPVFTASAAHGITSSDITNWNSKQAALVSGTNIKTVNGNSLLGSGNISISYSDFIGTDGTAAGTHGLVPAPATTDSGKFLSADGTWAEPPGSGSSISYVTKSENTYTTTSSSSISTIPIGIQSYASTDVLLVDINGLDLIQGTDYTISGTNIVLTTPITTSGTKVHFTALKMTTATTSDYATLKGEKGDDGHSPVVTASKSGTTTTVYVDGSSIASINDGTNGTHTISYTPIVTGGAQIGTITIDNTNYPLYAPAVVWG